MPGVRRISGRYIHNMTDSKIISTPNKTAGDHALALVRGAISSVPWVGGVGAELFALIVKAPYERRSAEWMHEVASRLGQLSERDEERFRALLDDPDFASVLIAATQAATRSHRREKTELLANAVEQSAYQAVVATDLQLLFVRFVDELTISHVRLLAFLETNRLAVAATKSYQELHAAYIGASGDSCTTEEFQLFCNDLAGRVLARFSSSLLEFPGIAESNALVTEDSGQGIKVVVSGLGRSFLGFVGIRASDGTV